MDKCKELVEIKDRGKIQGETKEEEGKGKNKKTEQENKNKKTRNHLPGCSTEQSPHLHGIAGILSIHELHFHCDIPGRSLAVGKVKALWIHIKEIPARNKGSRAGDMKIIPVLLFLVPLALPAGADKDFYSVGSAGSPETKSRFAMLDDVRILANGLLQLGHGLKDFVHKTKGQMNDIFQKLYIFDRSFYELSLQTSEIKEEEEQLRQTTARLQLNNEEIKNLSQEMNLKIEDLIQNKIQLQEQVWGLEDKVTKLAIIQPSVQETKEISSLKAFVEQQDSDIKQLLKIVEDQHVQLDRQHNQIMELEDKLNHIELQELLENSFTGEEQEQQEAEPIPSAVHRPTAGTYRADAQHTPSRISNRLFASPGAAADCTTLYHTGTVQDSGVYTIQPNGSEAFNVYCETKFGTSWTVIQRRVDGSLDFNQTWDAYTNGFGDLNEEFWLGLKKIYSITKQGSYLLRIELQDWRGNRRHIEYSFSLGGPSSNFSLQLHHSQCATNLPHNTSSAPAGQGSFSRIFLGFLGEDLTKPLSSGAQRGCLGTCDGSEPAQHRRGTSHVSQELVQVLITQAIPLLLRERLPTMLEFLLSDHDPLRSAKHNNATSCTSCANFNFCGIPFQAASTAHNVHEQSPPAALPLLGHGRHERAALAGRVNHLDVIGGKLQQVPQGPRLQGQRVGAEIILQVHGLHSFCERHLGTHRAPQGLTPRLFVGEEVMKEEEERRMNKCTKRKMNLKDVPMCEQNHKSSSQGSCCQWFNLSPDLLHAPKHQSPEIATQTHQVKRAQQRSWTSSDKEQVTQAHHPNQPHCCWRSRTCSAISPPAQLTSCGTRKKKTKPEADSPGLQQCDSVGQQISTITELPVLPAARGKVGNLLQQEGGTAEEDKAVLSHSPAAGRMQTQPSSVHSPFPLAAPGKLQAAHTNNLSALQFAPKW
ncbi:hypothetical protein IHE44_0015151 [Lamprotornis superbus]|uniref:Angiopoietin-related protein 3 n=1 Tax=Lamprotornis superbus TaxID=245042 RepID=A0A835NNW8_9PASS|nr:hypothetical protein IHE44_0015151 [Lamprotornis superbus]